MNKIKKKYPKLNLMKKNISIALLVCGFCAVTGVSNAQTQVKNTGTTPRKISVKDATNLSPASQKKLDRVVITKSSSGKSLLIPKAINRGQNTNAQNEQSVVNFPN